jgi:hypothetical protein
MQTGQGLLQTDPKEMAEQLSGDAWQAHPAGEGAKGLRLYDWAHNCPMSWTRVMSAAFSSAEADPIQVRSATIWCLRLPRRG